MVPHILWTDVLIYLLLAVIAGFAVYASRHEHLRTPWRRSEARRPMAMGALVMLLAFVAVGLLDAVHYRPRLPGSATQISSR